MNVDQYESPLVSRNSSPEMLRLFSMRHRIGLWRDLWIALAEEEQKLGLTRITNEAIAQLKAKRDDIDFASAAQWEKRLRHDVMAHVHAYEEAAPAAKGIIHLGATSQYVVDNADLMIYRDGLRLVASRLASTIDALGAFALKWKDLPCLGYTHYQPAQPTTVGKRATLWAQELVLGLERVEALIKTIRARGVKGTTGTQASFLSLFDGDHAKCDALDAAVSQRFDFDSSYDVTGQTYPRIVDAQIACDLACVAASVHRMCNDIRLLAGTKQIEEPFEAEQVGSSAMAYKRNPMRCERATGLSRFVMSLVSSPLATAAEQWLERTLDDSSNKRLSLPEMFLALDGCLLILTNVSRGLVVYPKTIEALLMAELPFMATEEILMAAVRAGGDRQHLHERIRTHSLAAAEQVKLHGRPNDLLERLRNDPDFAKVSLEALMDPKQFVGRAPQQTEAFVRVVVDPIRARYASAVGQDVQLKV
ncbi:MAG: adenylosuccinate lyase [Tepidisphaeraceae bacterium]